MGHRATAAGTDPIAQALADEVAWRCGWSRSYRL